jgi:hypothetical protein
LSIALRTPYDTYTNSSLKIIFWEFTTFDIHPTPPALIKYSHITSKMNIESCELPEDDFEGTIGDVVVVWQDIAKADLAEEWSKEKLPAMKRLTEKLAYGAANRMGDKKAKFLYGHLEPS